MNKKKAIPENYMTVGELAKKMGTTVRTLQYYDKEGLLSPTNTKEYWGKYIYSAGVYSDYFCFCKCAIIEKDTFWMIRRKRLNYDRSKKWEIKKFEIWQKEIAL